MKNTTLHLTDSVRKEERRHQLEAPVLICRIWRWAVGTKVAATSKVSTNKLQLNYVGNAQGHALQVQQLQHQIRTVLDSPGVRWGG